MTWVIPQQFGVETMKLNRLTNSVALAFAFLIGAYFGIGTFNVTAQSIAPANKTAAAQKDQADKQKQADKSAGPVIDPDLPNVLIIGDSISMGYTPYVKKSLEGKANVLHNPGNAAGTTNGVKLIEEWIDEKGGTRKWDVIHFNFGLHDLKHVKKSNPAEVSNDPLDSPQADLATYTKNLKTIVAALKRTDAKLIYATTTPFPPGSKPFRDPANVDRYNAAAVEIMKENEIPINDLHGDVAEKLKELQVPVNVHFTKAGSKFLGECVAEVLLPLLPAKQAP